MKRLTIFVVAAVLAVLFCCEVARAETSCGRPYGIHIGDPRWMAEELFAANAGEDAGWEVFEETNESIHYMNKMDPITISSILSFGPDGRFRGMYQAFVTSAESAQGVKILIGAAEQMIKMEVEECHTRVRTINAPDGGRSTIIIHENGTARYFNYVVLGEIVMLETPFGPRSEIENYAGAGNDI